MSDSNLFLASKELNIDNINFDDTNKYDDSEDKSLFTQDKIVFVFQDNDDVEDEIEILFIKYHENNIILKINLLTENIYNHVNKFPIMIRIFDNEFLIRKLILKNDGICKLKLQKGKNV